MNDRKGIKKKGNSLDKPEETAKKIGQRLKAFRKAKGYTNQETFAWEIGVSRSQYSEYEAGKNMYITTLISLLKKMNITPEEFFKDF